MALEFISPTAWVGSHVFDASQVENVACKAQDCTWEGDADVTYIDGGVYGTWQCRCGQSNEVERDVDDSDDTQDLYDDLGDDLDFFDPFE